MKKIQFISLEQIKFNAIENSTLDNPKALDSFDINIIDLASQSLWNTDELNCTTLNQERNMKLLQSMIAGSNKTQVIYIIPQNIRFYYYGGSRSEELKFILKNVSKNILSNLLGLPAFNLGYEPNVTQIGNFKISSSFFFQGYEDYSLTKAIDSNKITSIKWSDKIITSLDLNDEEKILSFLDELNLLENERKDIPEWMSSIQMFDDNELLEQKEENNKKINELKLLNENLMQQLDINNYYKSILYSSGDYLVEVVFKILEEMLQIDLSEFEDKKKEDMLFKKDGVTFIGEIKGINCNVRNDNLMQLENHVQNYNQDLQDKELEEVVKGILIINHQRTTTLNERKPIHNNQIGTANRNKSLIVETYTLLKMFELYKNNVISSQKVLELFKNKDGILKLEDLY